MQQLVVVDLAEAGAAILVLGRMAVILDAEAADRPIAPLAIPRPGLPGRPGAAWLRRRSRAASLAPHCPAPVSRAAGAHRRSCAGTAARRARTRRRRGLRDRPGGHPGCRRPGGDFPAEDTDDRDRCGAALRRPSAGQLRHAWIVRYFRTAIRETVCATWGTDL